MQLKQQEVNSATGLSQQTPQGRTLPLTAAEGQRKEQRAPAHPSVSRIPLSTCSSPFSICLHSASDGNEGCSPLTSPVKHILAGFEPAAGHFIK